MCDTKPFCDLCEMLPNGRHVFGCPADDGVVPSAAPAADTMREAFETELRRHFDPMQADLYLARDESDNYDLWAVMLAWECYRAAHEAGRQHGPPDDMKQAIVTTVNDAVDAAFERGRQLGMEQEHALWELSRDGQDIEHGYVTMTSADYAAALEAARQSGMEQARREPMSGEALNESLKLHRLKHDSPSQLADAFRIGARWAERYHGITPTPPAGDSDKPRHVCGAQGFGALGDVCPGCDSDTQS